MKRLLHCFLNGAIAKLSSVLLIVLSGNQICAQLSVNATVNAQAAVQNVLLGEGVTASNITFGGNQNTQIGSFNCNNCGLQLSSGVVLASGHIAGAVGPNNSGSHSQGPPNGLDYFGDPDLQALAGNTIHNAAILRFNFIPTGDSIAFRFVFGSDEYPEYVNSINDVFGFFISGPGITGPYQNSARNIALIPGTSNPVSINSVNQTVNSTWYRSNTNGQHNIQADGFTKVLTARANVICGETYSIKIAIGDASDGSWDSWVFLEAGSFQSNNVEMAYTPPNIASENGGLYEGCETAYLTFTRPSAQSASVQKYPLTYSGTAVNGLDIELLPDTLVFPAGQTTVSLPITAIQDGVQEGNETLTLTIEDLGCNAGDPIFIDVLISDLPNIVIDMPDVLINCGEQAVMMPQLSGGLGNYLVTWEMGLVQPSLSTYPAGPVSFNFVVTDTCGVPPAQGVANVVFVQNPPLLVDIGEDISAQCLDEIIVNSTVTGGFGEYSYAWSSGGFLLSDLPNVNFYDDNDLMLTLTVTDICQVSSSDQIQVSYPPVPVVVDIGPDHTATCIDQLQINSSVSGGIGNYSYSWMLGANSAGFSSAASVQTGVTTSLTLNVHDQCGNSSSDVLTITIPPVNILLDIGPDIVTNCLVNNTIAPIQLENGIGNYTYVWMNDGTNVSSASQYSIQTGTNKSIGLTVMDQCGNTALDQKQIIIPAAPIALTVFPNPDTVICLGTWATLRANAIGGVGALTYTWHGVTSTPSNLPNQSIVKESPASNSTYTVNVSDQCGNSNSGTMRVIVRELFPSFESNYVSDTEIEVQNITSGDSPFIWTFGDGSTSNESDVRINFLGAPAWTATLTIFSPEGCSKSVTQEFTAIGELFVPNAFTPDNDGLNDHFFIVGHDLRYFEMTIFNRYGEVVFKSYDIEEPWDGSHQGKDHFVPNGIYNYQLVGIGKRENIIERKGKITVLR